MYLWCLPPLVVLSDSTRVMPEVTNAPAFIHMVPRL